MSEGRLKNECAAYSVHIFHIVIAFGEKEAVVRRR